MKGAGSVVGRKGAPYCGFRALSSFPYAGENFAHRPAARPGPAQEALLSSVTRATGEGELTPSRGVVSPTRRLARF